MIHNAREADVNSEYIQLRASTQNTKRISLKDWRLESAITGRGIDIPEASYLPYTGTVNSELTVALAPNDRAYIHTGRSPIGVSFRTNICTGYFEQFQNFRPGLDRECPLPEEEILYTKYTIIFTDNECLDFIDRISRCAIPTKALPLPLSHECKQTIINEINYNSCIDKHKNDENFVGNEWRIYLKREFELWRTKRELIKLLDESGKTVDVLVY